jgi:flagellar assembly factor FliW
VMFTTVTVGRDSVLTTNLVGPIVINIRTLHGRQIVVGDERYGLRHVIGEKSSERLERQQAMMA